MTNAGRRDVDARIEDAVKRLQADGETLWWSLVNDLGFSFEEQHLLLSRLWDNLPGNQRAIAIAAAWTLSDPTEECLRPDEWLKMFRAVGYIEDGYRDRPPPAQITLWRGGVRKTGMSWTADRSVAVRFQHRFAPHKPPGKLWTVTVGANRLLAHFDVLRPGEDEYVVDPAGLAPIEIP